MRDASRPTTPSHGTDLRRCRCRLGGGGGRWRALTRWLGADADATPWSDSSVRPITIAGPVLLLACTDGLWNYLPDPDDIAHICSGHDPKGAASALVDYARRVSEARQRHRAVIPIRGHS